MHFVRTFSIYACLIRRIVIEEVRNYGNGIIVFIKIDRLAQLLSTRHQCERSGIRFPGGSNRHSVAHGSAAWRSGSERRFYDDHDRTVDGSPPNLVSLLRPWIRCITMIISAWWNLASSKLKKSEENSSGKLGNKGNS